MLSTIDRILCSSIVFLVRAYQITLSAIFPPSCRFYPSCSEYAITAFRKKPFFKAAWLSMRRILKCNPFHPGGYDPLN